METEAQLDDALRNMDKELEECPLLGVDLEYGHAICAVTNKTGEVNTDWMIISIIQLSTLKSDYVIDIYALRDRIRRDESIGSLKYQFARADVTKIMHGCDSDLKYLISDLAMPTINLFDTARAFSFM